jgi:uncharacterized protein with PQ loop repeat
MWGTMASLTCKHCGAAIPAESIGDGELAICNICDALNNLSSEPIVLPEKTKAKRNPLTPVRLRIVQLPDAMEIHYRWWNRHHWGLLLFTVLWNIPVLFTIIAANSANDFSMMGFFSLFVFVGLFLIYTIVTAAVNRSRIRIEDRGIDIIHRPLQTPTNRDKRIDRRSIEQVYCQRRVAYTSNDQPVYVFDVHYVEKGANNAVLVRGLETHEEALFIEQRIESLYQIEDDQDDKNHEMMEMMSQIRLDYDSKVQKRKNQ